jgi:hypothetical protein
MPKTKQLTKGAPMQTETSRKLNQPRTTPSATTLRWIRPVSVAAAMTGTDLAVLLKFTPPVLKAAHITPWLAAAFFLTASGLLLSLVRIWRLTICVAVVGHIPSTHHNESERTLPCNEVSAG